MTQKRYKKKTDPSSKQSVLKSEAAESSVTELTNYTYTVEPAGRRLGPLLFPAVLAKLGWLKF